jgi:hypothetical protein
MAGREDWLTSALGSSFPVSEVGARLEKRDGLEGTKGLMLFTRAALKSMAVKRYRYSEETWQLSEGYSSFD